MVTLLPTVKVIFFSKGHVSPVNEMKKEDGLCYFLIVELHTGMCCHLVHSLVVSEGKLPYFKVNPACAPKFNLWSQLPVIH